MVNFLSGMFGGGYEKEAAQKDIAAALRSGPVQPSRSKPAKEAHPN